MTSKYFFYKYCVFVGVQLGCATVTCNQLRKISVTCVQLHTVRTSPVPGSISNIVNIVVRRIVKISRFVHNLRITQKKKTKKKIIFTDSFRVPLINIVNSTNRSFGDPINIPQRTENSTMEYVFIGSYCT